MFEMGEKMSLEFSIYNSVLEFYWHLKGFNDMHRLILTSVFYSIVCERKQCKLTLFSLKTWFKLYFWYHGQSVLSSIALSLNLKVDTLLQPHPSPFYQNSAGENVVVVLTDCLFKDLHLDIMLFREDESQTHFTVPDKPLSCTHSSLLQPNPLQQAIVKTVGRINVYLFISPFILITY